MVHTGGGLSPAVDSYKLMIMTMILKNIEETKFLCQQINLPDNQSVPWLVQTWMFCGL